MRVWAVLAAIVTVLVLPAGAQASAYVRYGIQDDAWIRFGPGTLEQRLDRLESLGVDLVRMNVAWNEVEERQGAFDWSGYDDAVKGLNARHIEVLLTLTSTPAWANGGRGTNVAPLSGSTFAAFARSAAQQYPFVRRWLIWNEPNQRRWLQPTTPATYVRRLLNPAYAALHRVNPRALVGGGVTAPRAATGGVSPVAWINGMAAAHAHLDAYAHNPYTLSKAETPFTGGCGHCDTITMATLERLIATVGNAFGKGKRVWLTEFGYQTNPPDPFLGISKEKQALFVGQAALRAYLAPRVDMLVQFLVQDEPELARWQSGVLTAQGKAKPAYDAIRLPLAQRSRTGRTTRLWGQVRPGTGIQRYRLEELRNGSWKTVGSTRRTTRTGTFAVVVRGGAGAQFRAIALDSDARSTVLVVT